MSIHNGLTKHFDLAEGSWVAKIPAWLRWILFIPTAVIGSFGIATLFLLIVVAAGGAEVGSIDRYWYEILQSALLGGLFVYLAAYMAPKYQKVVGICALVVGAILITMLMTALLIYKIPGNSYSLFHGVVLLAGEGAAIYAIFEQS